MPDEPLPDEPLDDEPPGIVTAGAAHAVEGDTRSYDTVVVVGGGCYGSYYVRQLQRAVRAGALRIGEILVVDRDRNCAVAAQAAQPPEPWRANVRFAFRDWREFFAEYLAGAVVGAPNDDAIVPSPLMPHLMGEWLVQRARARWPGRRVETAPLDAVPDVPWERAGTDGTHYVSFATWMCPVNCVEPQVCPHTRGARSWSLPVTLEAYARGAAAASAAVLFCRHRSYGVGMFDTREVVEADAVIARAGQTDSAEVVIGTVSHCHGALTRLRIGPLVSAPAAGAAG